MPLIDYLPRSSQGLMLITTRDARISRRLGGRDTSIVVEAMLPSEAQDLLRSRSERSVSDNDDNSRIVVDELAYIPLAITQAAAFISENEISLAEYLEILRTGDSDLQDLLDEDLGDLRRDSESQNSVIRTWKISFDLISKQNPRAAEMLSLMAVLDRQGIPKSLLQNDTDRKTDFVTARGILQKFSLISTEDGGSKYELHRLVQLATRKWLEIQGTKEKWQEKALLVLLDMFPGRDRISEDWMICESLMPHVQTVTGYENIKKARPGQFAHLQCRAAFCNAWQGREDDAYMRASAALEMQGEFPDSEDSEYPFELESASTLLSVYRGQAWRDEAEEFTVRALEVCLRADKEHPLTRLCMLTLASVYRCQERWDKAEKLLVKVIEIEKRVLKEEHPDTLSTMAELATTYTTQGRLDEAENLLVRVIEMRKRVLKEEQPDTLKDMVNLAMTYTKQGKLDKAEELLVQVIKTQKRVLKEEHPDTLSSIIELSTTYSKQGRLDEAAKLQRRVLGIQERVLGGEHPDTLNCMCSLASTYGSQGRFDEAEKLQRQVLGVQERALGGEHLDTTNSMEALADTYESQGRFDEAEKLLVQVIEIRKKVLKEEHPATISSNVWLARTYLDQGRWNEAIELMQVVVKLRTKVLGKNHPKTLETVGLLDDWTSFPESDRVVGQGLLKVIGQSIDSEGDEASSALASLAFGTSSR